jgi:uncharacterized repeat protein (TIGR01451 family)
VDVEVSVSVNHAVVKTGQPLTYTIKVANNGPGSAPAVDIAGLVSSGLTVVSVSSSQGTCAAVSGLTCDLGAMDAGQVVTITVVAAADKPGTAQVSATASVACDSSGSCPVDSNQSNNESVAAAPIRARLRLTESVNRHVLHVGELATFKLRVKNPGPAELDHVLVCERLPLGLAFVSASIHPHLRNGSLCWTLATLAAHHAKTIQIVVQGLSGARLNLAGRATAVAGGVTVARAKKVVRVLPAHATAPAQVTG